MSFADLDALTIALGTLAFVAGGAVKGVLGVGLPLVTVPFLATVFDPPTALALMAVPAISSNLWQTFHGHHHGRALRRFWVLLVFVVAFTAVAAHFVVRIDVRTGSLVLGAIVIAFCLADFVPRGFTVPAAAERWLNPAVGTVAGLLGGVSNFYGPPIAIYLVALRLSKDEFVATTAICFIAGGVPLYASLAANGVLTVEALAASALAALPVLLGMGAGMGLRRRISQAIFQRLLVATLLVVGLNLVRRGLG